MSNVKSAQIVMLIVAMLAQTTTAVPAQRLLFPQHWLLAGWDMVLRLTKGLPSRSSPIDRRLPGLYCSTLDDGEELPALYTTPARYTKTSKLATPRPAS